MEKTLIDYLIMIRKRLWLIAIFVFLSCFITYYVSATFVKPVYHAGSQLLVTSSFKSEEAIDFGDITMNLSLIESYKQIIKSNKIMETVVANHPEFRLTEQELNDKTKVSSTDKTQIIQIDVNDGDYGKAVTMVNAITNTFIREIPGLMNMNNVKVLVAADPDKQPTPENASTAMNLAISFILSSMAALGAVLFLENINDTIRTDKEAEHFVGLPVLATIGTIKKSKEGQRPNVMSREVGEQTYAAVK